MIALLGACPSVVTARTRFALRAATTRILVFAALIYVLTLVSPLSWDYPSIRLAKQTSRTTEGMGATFLQV